LLLKDNASAKDIKRHKVYLVPLYADSITERK
jgi:hypothetical protein